MSKIVALDFETHFNSHTGYSLSHMSPPDYINHPLFTPQAMAARVNDGETKVYGYEEIPEALFALDLENPNTITVGHNISGFDALVLSQHYGIRPANIHDTMVMSRFVGLSMIQSESHAALTTKLGNGEKLKGTEISDGKRFREDFTDAEWESFTRYCRDDAEQCSKNYFALLPYVPQDALDFISLTAKMATEPCLIVDSAKLQAFISYQKMKAQEAIDRLSHRFNFSSEDAFLKAIRSPDKYAEMLRELGVEPPRKVSVKKSRQEYKRRRANGEHVTYKQCTVWDYALSKKDSEFLALREHEDKDVVALVEAKLELGSAGAKRRAERLLEAGRGGKAIGVMLQAFKAHTGRYAAGVSEGESDGLNFQNYPKRNKEMLELRKCIVSPEGHDFVSCDSSQIEARTEAFVAGEQWLIEAFRNGRDPYSEMASSIFHVPADEIQAKKGIDPTMKMYRNTGKIAILSAGYGVGAAKFAEMLWLQGAKLAENRQDHDRRAALSLDIYRRRNSRIVHMWDLMDKALEYMVKGRSFAWGGVNKDLLHFGPKVMIGEDRLIPSIVLPSGFTLRYPGLRREKDPFTGRWGYVYDQWMENKMVTKKIYGGLLTENIIQALAFQLLEWQALEMTQAGLELKCNIHDAFLACVPEGKAEEAMKIMKTHMSRVPDWFAGFPVACECSGPSKDFTIA